MADVESIIALINLIDDPDENIFLHVRDRLLKYGPDAIPYLENSWEVKDFGMLFQNRIENLIHEIQFEDSKNELLKWKNSSEKDLLKGAILIAKYQYPGLHDEKVYAEIERIQKDIWLEINNKQTALEKVYIFNKVIFDLHHFHGDAKHFHSPLNSYINTVLETKKGNPLSLSIIYSIIGQNLNIPIYGVNLPNHFVLAFLDEFGVRKYIAEENKHGVLFYINPFSKGTVFDENEIKSFLTGINQPHLKEYFEPCSNTSILKRMLTNLISSFQEVGNSEKVKELIELRELLED
ncbi:MAG: transglutaminase-like domain-containing protein [Fluviicola sp.]|nr:transglutaminase-like domain-containing protein [Fluviicola sp.]